MKRKAVSGIMLTLLSVTMLMLAFNIQPGVNAQVSEIIVDTEKGENRFTTYPPRESPYYWVWVHDHDVFHTRAYSGNFWYTLCGEEGHGEPLYYGEWEASLPQSGVYEVFVWIPDPDPFEYDGRVYTPTQYAVYQIYHKDGLTTRTVNQRLRTGDFYSLGTFNFDTVAKVILNDRTGEPYCSTMIAFDAIKFASVNNPPYTPYNPSPSNHASSVSVSADLSWSGGDPDAGDTVTYDVYFGTSTPPPLVSDDQSATTYDPALSYTTTYYWKIVATDNHGASAEGPLWDFTTESALPSEYTLTIYSSPSGVTFTVDGMSRTTPWSKSYSEGASVSLVMPLTHTVGEARYCWDQWSDGITSQSRTVIMDTDVMLTAYYIGPFYQLTITSSPVYSIPFTIDGASKTTTHIEWLPQGSYTIEMPETYGEYTWFHWQEDGDTNRIKTITLSSTTILTAVYTGTCPPWFDFGTVYVNSIVDASCLIQNANMTDIKSHPDWIVLDHVDPGYSHPISRNGSGAFYFHVDTSVGGSYSGAIVVQTNVGDIDVPVSLVVRTTPAPRLKMLVYETPFTMYSTFEPEDFAPMTRVMDTGLINVSYSYDFLPPEDYDLVLLAWDALWSPQDQIDSLKSYVESGGCLIVCADYFYRTSVDKANEIINDFGLSMRDEEYGYEIFATDFAQHPITTDVSLLRMLRPSPVESLTPEAIVLARPSGVLENEGVLAISEQANGGKIIVIGNSLWWYSFLKYGENYDNSKIFLNMFRYITPIPEDRPPTCVIKLRRDGIEIDEIDIGEFFDIYVGGSTDDTGIKQVRFSSDDSQDGIPSGEWTEWYNWDASSGDWNAETKTKRWAFATPGYKEVWAEVKDDVGQTAKCSANISANLPVAVITSPLEITPFKDTYYVGDILTAKFTITNRGTESITFDVLVVGGRDPTGEVVDFDKACGITLNPSDSYDYQGFLTLPDKPGTYHFFCAYQTPDGNWNTNIDVEIDGKIIEDFEEARRYREKDITVFEKTYTWPAPSPALWEKISGPWVEKTWDTSRSLSQIAVHPNNPDTIYAVVKHYHYYWGYQGDKLYKSTNAGADWSPINEGLPCTFDYYGRINAIGISPSNPDTIYLGITSLNPYSGLSGGTVYKSTNGGLKWTPISRPYAGRIFKSYYPISSMVVHPTNPDIVYAGTIGGGIWRTNDGGKSWKKIWDEPVHKETLLDVVAIAISPANPSVIYAAAYNFQPSEAMGWSRILIPNRLIKSEDGGETWERLRLGLLTAAPKIDDIVVDDRNADAVYVITCVSGNNRVYKSVDGGKTWSDTSGTGGPDPLPDVDLMLRTIGMYGITGKTSSISMHHDHSNVIYAASTWGFNDVYFSPNSGENWFPLGLKDKYGQELVLHIQQIVFASNTDSRVLYATGIDGLFKIDLSQGLIETRLRSPGELRVYDSQGRVTGLVNGEIKEEIPNSAYFNNTVLVLPPSGLYRFEVAGTDQGTYSLTTVLIFPEETVTQTFTGEIVEGAVYVYTLTIIDGATTVKPDPIAELENLEEFIMNLPDDVFVSDDDGEVVEFRKEMIDKIYETLEELSENKHMEATEKLNDMKEEVIEEEEKLEPTTQSNLCVIIDHIISSIETLQ